ncbi:MAG: aspartate aminotransferase family protein [Spirochaetia bacterium]|jgi:L-2,4-diaminobutyrate decarboxylase|nr:aspartate aminotransferase family protein [Spirochaetia bacterium]
MYAVEPLLLTNEKKSQEAFKKQLDATADAICATFVDDKAYTGRSPQQLQQQLEAISMLPKHGIGFEAMLDEAKKLILPNCLRPSSTSYMAHLHSPALLESISAELMITAFNQSMDSWDQAPIATEIEVEVIKNLCRMFGYGKQSDGVFTSGGSQTNFCALLLARDGYCNRVLHHDIKKDGLPASYAKFRLYASEVSHFSMEKSAHMLGLGYQAVRKVPIDANGKMDTRCLEKMIKEDLDKGNLPFCVVATIGTTDYGTIDDVQAIGQICKRYGLYLHADAAYGSGLIVSDTYGSRLGDLSSCDSITVDFHKMFLLPISCSALLVKDGSRLDAFQLHADYLNREEDEADGYVNLVGKSMQTTRRFDALKVWIAFRTRGKDGFGKIIDTCVENAAYLYDQLNKDSVFQVAIKSEISSVVFRLDANDETNKKIRRQLLLNEGIVIGQTVYQGKTYLKFTLLNPLVTHDHLDELVKIIKKIGLQLIRQSA